MIQEGVPCASPPQLEEVRILYAPLRNARRPDSLAVYTGPTAMASSGAHHDAACPTSPTSSGRFAECGSHDYIIPSSCSDDFPSFSETSERKQRGGRRALSLLRSASFAGDAHSSDYTDEVTLSDFERQLTTRRFSYDQRATRDFLYSPEGTERAVRGGCIALDVLSLDEEEISEFLSSDGDSLYCGTPMDVTPGSSCASSLF